MAKSSQPDATAPTVTGRELADRGARRIQREFDGVAIRDIPLDTLRAMVRVAFSEAVEVLAAGGVVSVQGFGKFYRHDLPARKIVGGLFKQPFEIGPRCRVQFISSEALNRRLSGGKS